MTTPLSAPVETSVSAVSALETARAQVEELVLLRTRIDAEIADAVRAYAQAEVAARLEQVAAGQVSVEQVEASIVDRLGRALRVSPTRARAQLRIGRDLHAGLDRVRDQFAAGEVAAVVGAASHLDPAERAEVDTRLAAHDLASLGQRRVADLARTIVAQVAPGKFTERAHAARRDRHVGIASAPDGMVVLRAVLPVEQGVACYAALRKAVTEPHWTTAQASARSTTWSARHRRSRGDQGCCRQARLLATLAGLPITWTLADPKLDERQVPIAALDHDRTLTADRPGPTILADKGYVSRELDVYLAERGVVLLRPSHRNRAPHPGEQLLEPVRQPSNRSSTPSKDSEAARRTLHGRRRRTHRANTSSP